MDSLAPYVAPLFKGLKCYQMSNWPMYQTGPGTDADQAIMVITTAVTMMFKRARGKRTFHPNFINWS